jgi:hypothetical protein
VIELLEKPPKPAEAPIAAAEPSRKSVGTPIVWREDAISRGHDWRNFDFGTTELNDYLRRYARQNDESGGTKTFVAEPPTEPVRILGYYRISPDASEFANAPSTVTSMLGRYEVTVFRLGWLAVAPSDQGR